MNINFMDFICLFIVWFSNMAYYMHDKFLNSESYTHDKSKMVS
jgi:hypothetical protein